MADKEIRFSLVIHSLYMAKDLSEINQAFSYKISL